MKKTIQTYITICSIALLSLSVCPMRVCASVVHTSQLSTPVVSATSTRDMGVECRARVRMWWKARRDCGRLRSLLQKNEASSQAVWKDIHDLILIDECYAHFARKRLVSIVIDASAYDLDGVARSVLKVIVPTLQEVRERFVDMPKLLPEKEYDYVLNIPFLFDGTKGFVRAMNVACQRSNGLKNACLSKGNSAYQKVRIQSAGGVMLYEDGPKMIDAYLIALLCIEEYRLDPKSIEIVCSYPNEKALMEAYRGVFDIKWFVGADGVIDEDSKYMIETYFDVLSDGQLQVKSFVRACITPRVAWAEEVQESQSFDIVLYRNVGYKVEDIYPDGNGERSGELRGVRTNIIAGQLQENLNPEGFLVTTEEKWFPWSYFFRVAVYKEHYVWQSGRAEYPDTLSLGDQTVDITARVYQKILEVKDDAYLYQGLLLPLKNRVLHSLDNMRAPSHATAVFDLYRSVSANTLRLRFDGIVNWAYAVAQKAHKDVSRSNGEPYLYHVISTSRNVFDEFEVYKYIAGLYVHGAGENEIFYTAAIMFAVSLLHDVVEDSDMTYSELENQFRLMVDVYYSIGVLYEQGVLTPEDVLSLMRKNVEQVYAIFLSNRLSVYELPGKNEIVKHILRGVTLLTKDPGDSEAAYLAKIAGCGEPWIIAIKLADKVHNLLTPRYTWTKDRAEQYLRDAIQHFIGIIPSDNGGVMDEIVTRAMYIIEKNYTPQTESWFGPQTEEFSPLRSA